MGVVSYREDTLVAWKEQLSEKQIPSTDGFTLRSTLGEEVAIREWVINKLPNDEFSVENAIPFGTPVLIENVGEVLDPVLEPVLLKQVVVRGGTKTLKFGDGEIEYDDAFLLFITSKMRNPHYPPELCVKVNLLNFMATAEGLEDQMLGLAVACEEAALEQQREALVLEDAENKRALKEIEDKILYLLKNSKIKSVKIEKKQKIAAKTFAIIAKTRIGY